MVIISKFYSLYIILCVLEILNLIYIIRIFFSWFKGLGKKFKFKIYYMLVIMYLRNINLDKGYIFCNYYRIYSDLIGFRFFRYFFFIKKYFMKYSIYYL